MAFFVFLILVMHPWAERSKSQKRKPLVWLYPTTWLPKTVTNFATVLINQGIFFVFPVNYFSGLSLHPPSDRFLCRVQNLKYHSLEQALLFFFLSLIPQTLSCPAPSRQKPNNLIFFNSLDFSEAGIKAVIRLIYLTQHCYR